MSFAFRGLLPSWHSSLSLVSLAEAFLSGGVTLQWFGVGVGCYMRQGGHGPLGVRPEEGDEDGSEGWKVSYEDRLRTGIVQAGI